MKKFIVKKWDYNGKIKNIEDKTPSITNLATNATLDAKINEVKDKMRSINKLDTTIAPTAFENKIPNLSDLVKKRLWCRNKTY